MPKGQYDRTKTTSAKPAADGLAGMLKQIATSYVYGDGAEGLVAA